MTYLDSQNVCELQNLLEVEIDVDLREVAGAYGVEEEGEALDPLASFHSLLPVAGWRSGLALTGVFERGENGGDLSLEVLFRGNLGADLGHVEPY